MPDISRIKLPSGTTYDIKDTTARNLISGGVTFIIAWNGTGTPTAANLPKGVVAGSVTGTLEASADTIGKFYLVKSSSQQDPTLLDIYDEYVTIDYGAGTTPQYAWEKIGDTQIKLTAVVTDVTLNKQTTNFVTGIKTSTTTSVIGKDATFTVTQPTITVTPSTTYIKGTASGTNVGWNSKDQKTVVTGYNSPSTTDFITTVTPTSKKLTTTSITGVSGSTTASKATTATAKTAATGGATTSNSNNEWLRGIDVLNEVLTLTAATLNTDSIPQYTFADVTVPTAAASATTVATGALQNATSTDTNTVIAGITTANDSAITGLGTASTANVIGASSTFTPTNPTITLATDTASGTGKVSIVNGITSAEATNGAVAWNNQKTVQAITTLGEFNTAAGLNTSTDLTVTHGS